MAQSGRFIVMRYGPVIGYAGGRRIVTVAGRRHSLAEALHLAAACRRSWSRDGRPFQPAADTAVWISAIGAPARRPAYTPVAARGVVAIVLLVLLLSASLGAQVGTEPMAWAPEHRDLADKLGTAAVIAQIAAEVIKAWRSDHRKAALLRAGCRLSIAAGASEVLKLTVEEWRPNGVDRHSFPSMHAATASSMMGWRVEFAVPLAAFVGMSRSNANVHHFYKDVLPGWAIGSATFMVCRETA